MGRLFFTTLLGDSSVLCKYVHCIEIIQISLCDLSIQFFLSNRAVYFLMWNIRLGFEHAGLDFWLSSVACHAPKAPIFVVGTHCDKVTGAM